MNKRQCMSVCAILLAILMIGWQGIAGETVIVNPAKTYHAVSGWEATGIWYDVGADGYYTSAMVPHKDQAADMAVNQLGLNRIRLELTGCVENPVDVHGHAPHPSEQVCPSVTIDAVQTKRGVRRGAENRRVEEETE